MGKSMSRILKRPRKLLVRYGELWLLRDVLEQMFLSGVGTVEDRITYAHILDEISELRKKLRG